MSARAYTEDPPVEKLATALIAEAGQIKATALQCLRRTGDRLLPRLLSAPDNSGGI